MFNLLTTLAADPNIVSIDDDWLYAIIKAVMIVGLYMTLIPVLTLIERRGSAFMQDRVGPNRIKLFGLPTAGLLFPMADGLKFMFKEEELHGRRRRSSHARS